MRPALALAVLAFVVGCAGRDGRVDAPSAHVHLDRPLTDAEASYLAREKARAEALRGIAFTREIEARVVDARGMRARHGEALDRDYASEVERFYRALGLLPRDYALAARRLAYVERELDGAYLSREDTILVREDVLGELASRTNALVLRRLVLLHELVHALQYDPGYGSRLAVYEGPVHFDAIAVRTAVMEGDATFSMAVAYAQAVGVDPARIVGDPRLFELLVRQMYARSSETASVGDAHEPDAPIEHARSVAPYLLGLRFVAGRFAEGGFKAIDMLHYEPPRSMEQVMHPELEGASSVPDRYTEEGLARFDEVLEAAGFTDGVCDRFGELGLLAFFEAISGEVTPGVAAEGWSGDIACRYAGADDRDAALWLTSWDSIRDAVEAAAAFRQVAARLATEGRGARVHRVQRVVAMTIDVPAERDEAIAEATRAFAFGSLRYPHIADGD